MKNFSYLLLIIVFIKISNVYAQSNAIVDVYYDKETKSFSTLKGPNIDKNKDHTIVFHLSNTFYYNLIIVPNFLKRDITIPTLPGNFIFIPSTGVSNSGQKRFSTLENLPDDLNTLIKKLPYQTNSIAGKEIDIELKYLNHLLDIQKYLGFIDNKILKGDCYKITETISVKMKELVDHNMENLLNIPALSQTLNQDITVRNIVNVLNNITNSTLIDIDHRISYQLNLFTDYESIIKYKNLKNQIEANKKNYLKTIDMFDKALKCRDEYTYSLKKLKKSHYVTLNATLIGNRFNSKPDTLVSEELKFYKTKYWGADVSAGLFYNNLRARNYYYTDNQGNTASENKYNSDVVIGALVHYNYFATSHTKFGFCLGAGLSPIDSKVKYLLGGNIVLGRKNHFTFSGGLALANLPYPSKGLKLASGNAETKLGTTVTQYNKFRAGFFAGISYNLIKY